jgi:hypothetical protein
VPLRDRDIGARRRMTMVGHVVAPLRSPYGEGRRHALTLAAKRTRHGSGAATALRANRPGPAHGAAAPH